MTILQRRQTLRQSRERGQAAIELIGFAVIVVIVGLLAVQGVLLAQTHGAVQEAARHGARDYSQHGDWSQARGHIDSALPGWVENVDVQPSRSGHSTSVVVSVDAPIGLPSLSLGSVRVTRDAEFRTGD